MARLPLDGNPRVTSVHGQKTSMGHFGKHLGTDRAVVNQPFYAPASGVVKKVLRTNVLGLNVEVLMNGTLWRFAHLSSFRLRPGDSFGEGVLLGVTGNSGVTTGAHLHYDARKDGTNWDDSFGNYYNPEALIDEWNKPKPQIGRVPKSIYLKPTIDAYAFYRPGTPIPVKRANRAGELNPRKWGGITYTKNIKYIAPNTFQLDSPSLGTIIIWAGDRDSEVRY